MTAPSRPQPVLPASRQWPLHTTAGCRAIEARAAATLPAHTLMTRAGEAVARLALALAPHARDVEVWCGPGNNGGDGFIAAALLRAWGKDARIVLVGDPARAPDDARQAWRRSREAGVPVVDGLPERVTSDLALDALLGLGVSRALSGPLASAVERLNDGGKPILAVDLPSGLDSDTGMVLGVAVRATHTLALLTLKPGLFTGHGRDHAGRIWFDDLSVPAESTSLALAGPESVRRLSAPRLHAQHKGSFGDVMVLAGTSGMVGAGVLAARAALAAGAGRVYLGLLAGTEAGWFEPSRPELMSRTVAQLTTPSALAEATVVCGCGGGSAVRDVLPPVLHHARRLVLDADGLNTVAAEPALQRALRARAARGLATVLTPHPLEAARLLNLQSRDVQAARLDAAHRLVEATQCTVLLKGSGTIVAAPGQITSINPTGDARLGTAGSGDVLAGWLGGLWAAQAETTAAHAVAQAAAWLHGATVDQAPVTGPLLASRLIDALVNARDALQQAR